MTSDPLVRPRFLRVLLAAWLVLSALSAAWSIATPPGGAPDEPAHMVKAASVVRGQLVGDPGSFGHIVQVPAYVQQAHYDTCFAFQPDEAADCAEEQPADPGRIIDGSTTAGLYNPLYYAVVGAPTLVFGDQTGLYAMRLVSSLLTALFAAAAVAMISTWRRPLIPLLGAAFALTPMVVFLGGTVNPNGVETTAVLAAFVAMLGVVIHPARWALAHRAGWLTAGAVVAGNTRGISLLWVAAAIVVPLLLLRRHQLRALLRTRAIRIAIGVTAVGSAAALAWVLGSSSLTAGTVDAEELDIAPGIGASPLTGFRITLVGTLGHALNMIGIFGWLDTPAPDWVYFTWAVVAGGVALAAAVLLRGRHLLVALLVLAGLVLLPALIQGVYITGGGLIWQGRYALPAFVCWLVGSAALLALQGRASASPSAIPWRRLVLILASLWALGQFGAFLTALKRYAVGADGAWGQFLRAPEWAPPGGVIPTIVVFGLLCAVSAAGLIALVGVRRRVRSR